jgi:hypothetical protein
MVCIAVQERMVVLEFVDDDGIVYDIYTVRRIERCNYSRREGNAIGVDPSFAQGASNSAGAARKPSILTVGLWHDFLLINRVSIKPEDHRNASPATFRALLSVVGGD